MTVDRSRDGSPFAAGYDETKPEALKQSYPPEFRPKWEPDKA